MGGLRSWAKLYTSNLALRLTLHVTNTVFLHVHVYVFAVLLASFLLPLVYVVRVTRTVVRTRTRFRTALTRFRLFLLLHPFVLRSPVLEPHLDLEQKRNSVRLLQEVDVKLVHNT